MGQPDCWFWPDQQYKKQHIKCQNITKEMMTRSVDSGFKLTRFVDSVFGNDKLCWFWPRLESTFWTLTQNISTQILKFPILLFHIKKVGARINKMGHHFSKMGHRNNKWCTHFNKCHPESTEGGAPTIWYHHITSAATCISDVLLCTLVGWGGSK